MDKAWPASHYIFQVDSMPTTKQQDESITPSTRYYQQADCLQWEKVPQAHVVLIRNSLGEDPFGDQHWIFRMVHSRLRASSILAFMDPGETIFLDAYRQKLKQLYARGYWAQTWNVCDSKVGAACRIRHTVTFCGVHGKQERSPTKMLHLLGT